MPTKIPESKWEWFGFAGHFICGQWCRFHLCTKVGEYLISTVGMYVHPRRGAGSERAEGEWIAKNPNGEQIGYDRFYETFVFKAGAPCAVKGCNCGLPTIVGSELNSLGGENPGEATANHMMMCKRYAAR